MVPFWPVPSDHDTICMLSPCRQSVRHGYGSTDLARHHTPKPGQPAISPMLGRHLARDERRVAQLLGRRLLSSHRLHWFRFPPPDRRGDAAALLSLTVFRVALSISIKRRSLAVLTHSPSWCWQRIVMINALEVISQTLRISRSPPRSAPRKPSIMLPPLSLIPQSLVCRRLHKFPVAPAINPCRVQNDHPRNRLSGPPPRGGIMGSAHHHRGRERGAGERRRFMPPLPQTCHPDVEPVQFLLQARSSRRDRSRFPIEAGPRRDAATR